MTNKNTNGIYLLPLSPMRKVMGGMRFDISLGEVKSPASQIQFHECCPGTAVSQGIHLKNPRKDRQCFPWARTQDPDEHGSNGTKHSLLLSPDGQWFFRIKICGGLSSWRRKKHNSQVKFLWHSAVEVLCPSHITGNVKKWHSSYNLKNKECPE